MWLQRSREAADACAGASAYSGGARLQVGGAVSHHHHRLEAVLLLQDADDLPFAAALGCGLTLVETGVLAWKITTEELESETVEVLEELERREAVTVEVELEAVGVDVMLRDVQLGGHVFHDAAEATRDEEDLHVPLVQRIHQLPGEREDRVCAAAAE